MPSAITTHIFPVKEYDLDATLSSGQAFRWQKSGETWLGIIANRWIRLRCEPNGIRAEAARPMNDWSWLVHYLQLDVDLSALLLTFPDDEPMRAAIQSCRGLRLLRQDPWECLASFILSSTKQIVQIQQIIGLLCERFGQRIETPPGFPASFSFPTPEALAGATESALRECKMGFRAPYLLESARAIARGEISLNRLQELPLEQVRNDLVRLPGVGRKIADCVLLFAYGFQSSFPVDVWVAKALRQLYFPRRRVHVKRLHLFAATHFGPHAGYAQQYLFHYMRTKLRTGKTRPRASGVKLAAVGTL